MHGFSNLGQIEICAIQDCFRQFCKDISKGKYVLYRSWQQTCSYRSRAHINMYAFLNVSYFHKLASMFEALGAMGGFSNLILQAFWIQTVFWGGFGRVFKLICCMNAISGRFFFRKS